MSEEIKKYKIIIKYSRDGAAKYISHLDMQRTFGRAIRRAQLPAEYSQGFNPHIVMSFASPLSVGYATKGDYLELNLESRVDACRVKDALNAVMPRDIRILDVHEAGIHAKKLMAQNYSARYLIYFHFENEEEYDKIITAARKLMASETYMATDRRGRELDIRPLILEMEPAEKNAVCVLLKNASDGALNPAVVAMALCSAGDVAAEYDICREDCFALENGEMKPFGII